MLKQENVVKYNKGKGGGIKEEQGTCMRRNMYEGEQEKYQDFQKREN